MRRLYKDCGKSSIFKLPGSILSPLVSPGVGEARQTCCSAHRLFLALFNIFELAVFPISNILAIQNRSANTALWYISHYVQKSINLDAAIISSKVRVPLPFYSFRSVDHIELEIISLLLQLGADPNQLWYGHTQW